MTDPSGSVAVSHIFGLNYFLFIYFFVRETLVMIPVMMNPSQTRIRRQDYLL